MSNKRNFETIELGTTYRIPKYRVVDNEGIKLVSDLEITENTNGWTQEVTFVRGDKTVDTGDKENPLFIPRTDGILHESLIAILIEDLRYKNTLVPNRHTSIAITHLEEALFRLEERVREREINGTLGTYTK